MKTKKSSHRAGNLALAILLPTLSAALPAHAAEHVVTFETNLDGWMATEGSSSSDWARRAGGTPSGYTGPTGARAGQWYLYLESSYPNYPRKIAWLQSPRFEEAVSRVTFYYHMYGSDMGALALETSADGVAWNPVWSITGQQHASGSANWTRKQIDLSGGTVRKIRFKGTTGAGYRGDMAIDQVTVTTGEGSGPPTTASPWSKSGKHIYYADPEGGNVGIGDNAPTADLSVLGNLSRALTGYVSITAGSRAVTGEETLLTEELRVGESLLIGSEVFTITGIGSNTALTVDTTPTASVTNAAAYADSDLLIVETGAEKAALVVDRAGNVGIGVAVPKAKLDVAGGIKIGNENETVCDAGKAGTIRYDDAGKAVEVCDGSGWSRAGLQGERGSTGAQGEQGLQGLKGDTGETGPQGKRGPAGSQGPPGKAGQNGADGADGADGKSAYQIWLDAGNTGTEADFIAFLKGEKGEKGDPGTIGSVLNLEPLSEVPENATSGNVYFNSSGALCVYIDGGWAKVTGNGACVNSAIDLVAYYPFNGNVNDESGNGNNGTVNGATLTVDRFGNSNSAYWFDGNDKIIVNALNNFEWGDKFSVSVWFKRTGQWGNYQGIVANGYYTNGSWEIRMGRENSGTMLGGGIVTSANNATWDHVHLHASQNQWHHVVMSYDGNNLSFYLDGELKGVSTRDVGNLIAKNTPLTIGKAGIGKNNEYFYGAIDDIRIYKRALSIGEVRDLYDF